MRRFFTILLLLTVVFCVRQGYEAYTSAMYVTKRMSGSLSDIAQEVVAIPLRLPKGLSIVNAKNIRQNGQDLFLVNDGVLYRFNRRGDFVAQITDPRRIEVAGYVIDQTSNELIVLGNTDDVFYYSYDGTLLRNKRVDGHIGERSIRALSMYKERLWTFEERSYIDPDTQQVYIEKELVSYNTSFQEVDSYKVVSADIGRTQYLSACFDPKIGVDPDTGGIYVYSPSLEPDFLLEDTLYIQSNWRAEFYASASQRAVPLFPISSTGRFFLSSNHRVKNGTNNYTFCYDRELDEYKQLNKGLKDDFYMTGNITNLEPLDVFNHSYSFCKSGKDVKKAFPDRSNSENAVVFIVRLKV